MRLDLPDHRDDSAAPDHPYGGEAASGAGDRRLLRAQERHQKPFSAALLRYQRRWRRPGRRLALTCCKANVRFPRILDAAYDVALGLRSEMVVTGDKFPTKDGSAQRDYIHVSDLVDAHVLLMFALKENDLLYYNVGNGQPYTVLEIVEVAKKVSGRPIKVIKSPARPGDPPILYTDPKKIQYELGWKRASPTSSRWCARLGVARGNYGNPPARSIDPLMHNYVAFTAENDTAPALKDNPRIVVIGAGPTGLCAASAHRARWAPLTVPNLTVALILTGSRVSAWEPRASPTGRHTAPGTGLPSSRHAWAVRLLGAGAC